MRFTRRAIIGLKAVTQLGIRQVWSLLRYRFLLHSGLLRLLTPTDNIKRKAPTDLAPHWFYTPPQKYLVASFGDDYIDQTIIRADEVLSGQARLFGACPQPIQLDPLGENRHWTAYERGFDPHGWDLKNIWEPARFDWALWLAKAYYFTGNEKYVCGFLEYWDVFCAHNPVNIGPNWQSGQEIAIRMINLIICLHFFKESPSISQARCQQVYYAICQHAARILVTMDYAKAQNNNHLMVEAVGLYGAGVFLPGHPHSARWKALGRRWFNQAIAAQIGDNGEYIQHSANYHRMMLMISIWMQHLLRADGEDMPVAVHLKLNPAVYWLREVLDEPSGKTPNLGHNDGSFILPFTICDYADYRPVLQASSRAFLSHPILKPGTWDDLSIWLGLIDTSKPATRQPTMAAPFIHRLGSQESWASLRAAKYQNRPAHADQLHVEIWHQGINLARDAGTYLYNAPTPWENSLAGTQVHNTIIINQQDQMLRAGRFLWLDWAQATLSGKTSSSVTVSHNGYRQLGVIHERTLEQIGESAWLISDCIQPVRVARDQTQKMVQLHWLIGDFDFTFKDLRFAFKTPDGILALKIWTNLNSISPEVNIIRAGISQIGLCDSIVHGWWSPTYGAKEPAISILYKIPASVPLTLYSHFQMDG